MTKLFRDNKEKIVLVCSILIRSAGVFGTVEAFAGNAVIAAVCGVITGTAYEVKSFVEKKQAP